MKWTAVAGVFNFVLYAIGGTEEQLLENVLKQEFALRQAFPTVVFTRTQPRVFWFEFNSANFGFFINDFAQQVWSTTYLGNTTTAYPFIQVEPQPSPRKTWSHGH